jgi:hypothetical protein
VLTSVDPEIELMITSMRRDRTDGSRLQTTVGLIVGAKLFAIPMKICEKHDSSDLFVLFDL